MNRLWLTDQQSKTLCKALRNQILSLHKCAYEAGADGDHDAEERFVEEANALDDILDIIDKED